MPKVEISKRFNVQLDAQRTVEYKPRPEAYEMPQAHAELAVKRKAGRLLKAPAAKPKAKADKPKAD